MITCKHVAVLVGLNRPYRAIGRRQLAPKTGHSVALTCNGSAPLPVIPGSNWML